VPFDVTKSDSSMSGSQPRVDGMTRACDDAAVGYRASAVWRCIHLAGAV